MSLWGGRFERAPEQLFRQFNDSLPVDYRLASVDLEGSAAWARALGRAGVLEEGEVAALCDAIDVLRAEVERDPAVPLRAAPPQEDVHSWVEVRLVAQLGDTGRKLHTGRSRNDQVATDIRLWLRRELTERAHELSGVRTALLDLAERESECIMPGYTHLQRAQPVLFAHWCLAWCEALERDGGRFSDAGKRMDECPLGCGALAGTGYSINRTALADDLGFARVSANSLDAVSARDHILEVLAAAAICGTTLSRLAEDLIFFASGEAGFVTLDDAVTSGSSLMPQKKNPDALELIRGRSGRLIGSLTGLLVVVKGLPLAYNKDLQEDKEPLFDAMTHLSMSLRMVQSVLSTLRVDRDRTRAAAEAGYSNATDLADLLVERGVPFRTAHEIVGRLVREAIREGCPLERLPAELVHSIAPQISAEDLAGLTIEAGLARRSAEGGTAPARVSDAIRRARQRVTVRDEATS